MTSAVEQRVTEYRQRRTALEAFDVNCWLGSPLEPAFTLLDGVADLKAALHRYGIRRAVVSHTMCVRYGAMEGNRELLEAIGGQRDWVAAATLVPEMASGGGWDKLLRAMVADGVRVVRLFPRSHNFLLADDFLGRMLVAVRDLRLPLMIRHTEAAWPEIARLLGKFPDLPVIVEGTGRKLFYDNRSYYPLLERYGNLFLETHNVTNYLGLDDLVKRFGSRQFLFGSYFPHLDPNSSLMPIGDGEMEEEDRLNVAHANLERLLAEVQVR
ncbi:MAG: amidohydrolase family protein [Rhodopirellula sp.]|nr:amidohydrolase family protein [Rhodopirellula sp.]